MGLKVDIITLPDGLKGEKGDKGDPGDPGGTALPGTILLYGGSTAPSGFLLCDGSAVSRQTYANLFAVIGTNFGLGDGSTTFNLPDLRGRVGVGMGQGSGLTNRSMGATGGEESHALASAENGPHTHNMDTYNSYQGYHTHLSRYNSDGSTIVAFPSGSSGTGMAHNTMPPFIVINFIIKY